MSRPSLGPALFAVFLVLVGLVCSLVVVGVCTLVAHHTKRYREWIVFGAFVAGVPMVAYSGAALLEGLRALWGTVRKLRWVHGLWFLIFFSGLILRKRSSSEITSNPVDSAAALRIALVTLVGVILLLALFMRRTDWIKSLFTGIIGLLTTFCLMALVSTLYSVYWEWTLYKACEYSVDVALVATIVYLAGNSEDMKTFSDWNWILWGVLLLTVWFGCVWDPTDALSHNMEFGESGIGLISVQLMGVFPDVAANATGELGAIIGAIALARLLPMNRQRYDRLWYTWLFLAACTTMLFAQTRSAIAGFAFAVFMIFLVSRRIIAGAVIVLSGGATVLFSGLYQTIWEYLQRGQSTTEMTSLSSRLNWWKAAIEKLGDAPLTGLGMWAASRFGVLAKLGQKMTSTMHSDWVEILVGLSFWGIIPVALILIWSWWILLRYVKRPDADLAECQLALECIGVLSVLTVRMFFMTDLAQHPALPFFVPLAYAEYLRRKGKLGTSGLWNSLRPSWWRTRFSG